MLRSNVSRCEGSHRSPIDLERLRDALGAGGLGCTGREIAHLWCVLEGMLHLSNLLFTDDATADVALGSSSAEEVGHGGAHAAELQACSTLLGLPHLAHLLWEDDARVGVSGSASRGSVSAIRRTAKQASEVRQALMEEVHSALFHILLAKLNHALAKTVTRARVRSPRRTTSSSAIVLVQAVRSVSSFASHRRLQRHWRSTASLSCSRSMPPSACIRSSSRAVSPRSSDGTRMRVLAGWRRRFRRAARSCCYWTAATRRMTRSTLASRAKELLIRARCRYLQCSMSTREGVQAAQRRGAPHPTPQRPSLLPLPPYFRAQAATWFLHRPRG